MALPSSEIEAGAETIPLPSLKDFASSEPALRRAALNTILTHLRTRPSLSPPTPTQSLQLWRALSVALYMHDSKNPVSVQNIIATLAGTFRLAFERDLEVLGGCGEEAAAGREEGEGMSNWTWLSTHHTAFWTLLALEWRDYDAHRINKYLLLVRLVVREVFGMLLSPTRSGESTGLEVGGEETGMETSQTLGRQARQELVATQVAILEKLPLSTRERKVPDGLRLHVLDVWEEELQRAIEGAGEEEGQKETVEVLMGPVRTLGKEALGKGVRMRARDVVGEFDRRHG